MAEVHGLAATIRSSTESETFDLGGLSASTIESVVQQAFQDGFALEDDTMIRITLIIGAGKQARQKYDAQALKVVTSTLQSVGFAEDRGASGVRECAGLYKFQHDTGKNVKTVVVFPKVLEDTSASAGGGGASRKSTAPPVLLPDSMEAKVAMSSMPVFRNMVQAKCPTWSQKKALLRMLDNDILAKVDECDQLLMKGQPLSDSQQQFYDSCIQLTDKRSHVQEQMHAHVDREDLTELELHLLQGQVKDRVDDLQKQGKSTAKALERQNKLAKIQPTGLSKLKHHAALGKLWKQIAPLQHLDEHGSGKLLSVQETRLLGQKMDLMQQIEELEEASRGWLEDDNVFDKRLQDSRREFQLKFGIQKKSKKTKTSSGTSTPSISANTKVHVPVNKWVTPTATLNSKAQALAKKKARMKRGDLFGAMMATDDGSDEDDDEDDDVDDTPEPRMEAKPDNTVQDESPTPVEASASTKSATTKKKNKKKNKKKGQSSHLQEDTPAEVKTKSSPKQEGDTAVDTTTSTANLVVYVVKDILIPVIMAVITWLLTLILGRPKQKKKRG